MIRVIRNKKDALDKANGTSLIGYVDLDFMELSSILGEPTFEEPSGDNKIQVEWVCEYKGNIFTIYDWKTYDREFTLTQLNQFHIGGNDQSLQKVEEFAEFLESQALTNKI